MRCEIYRMEMPSALSSAMILNRIRISSSVRAAVGSSMMITFAPMVRHFAISVICDSATDRFRTLVRQSNLRPKRSSSSWASLYSFFQSTAPYDVLGSLPRYMFSATDRSRTMLNSWYIMAIPLRSASLVEWNTTSSPLTYMCPEVYPWAPAIIFIRVDLPAPFSPHRACTSPLLTSRWTPSRALTPGNVFTIESIRNTNFSSMLPLPCC